MNNNDMENVKGDVREDMAACGRQGIAADGGQEARAGGMTGAGGGEAEGDGARENAAEDPKAKAGANLKEWIKDIVIAVIIGLLIIQFVRPTIVKEHSMEPTLQENDYIFLSKQAYRFEEPMFGNIIVFHSGLKLENGREKLLVKRIIGLPGDTISISDGVVYRNGQPLKEDYTKDGFTAGYMDEITVPEGELFVMGDNRQNSTDSRDQNVGFVSEKQIVGEAVVRLFPFNKIGFLD